MLAQLFQVDHFLTEPKYSPLGKRILELQGDMTETELCERLDLSRNQLYNIKRGKTGTSPETIERMVHAFGLMKRHDVVELYDLAGFRPPKSLLDELVDADNRDAKDMLSEIRQNRQMLSKLMEEVRIVRALLEGAPTLPFTTPVPEPVDTGLSGDELHHDFKQNLVIAKAAQEAKDENKNKTSKKT